VAAILQKNFLRPGGAAALNHRLPSEIPSGCKILIDHAAIFDFPHDPNNASIIRGMEADGSDSTD